MAHFSVVGLDLSLTGAGVATIEGLDNVGSPSCAVHTFGRKGKRGESLSDRLARLMTLVEQVEDVVGKLHVHPDVITIETPAQNQTTGSTHDRSGLWWLVVQSVEQGMGIPVVEIGVTKVKTYAHGKGIGSKDEIMAAAIRRYPDVPISNNNESDAFVLAAMGARLIGHPIDNLPQTHLRAMEGIAFK